MNNKELVQKRLGQLKGKLAQLDSSINRGGTRQEVNQKQLEIKELVEELSRIIDREY